MSPYEILTPDKADENKGEVPGVHLNQTIDGVESPVELSKQDQMIKTKVEYYFDETWTEKQTELFDKWKHLLYGGISTILMLGAAYLGRVTG